LVLVLLAGAVLGTVAWLRWPDVASLALENPEQVASIEREREARGGTGVQWTWVGLRDISPHLIRAVLVAEDIDFFSHSGFSWSELKLAWEEARAGGRARGASTITQQLAKNLWLSPERSVWRKLREAVLTIDLERQLSKRRILDVYLNVVEFGPGVFGAAAAAEHYFGKSPLFLTEEESAELAAGLSRPSQWNPSSSSEAYRERVQLVLKRMANAEFLWRHIAAL
jgi:monofunctional biosynthetic peptidoglycan transglycosylase